MPDQLHQSIVESIEAEPEIALELVARAHLWSLPEHTVLEVANAALSDAKPVTGAADLVIRLRNAAGDAVFAIIVEVQMQDDPDKEWAWPKYWALVRERERSATMVLVIAGDDATARWANKMLRSGDPHEWHPFVTTLGALPRITDEAEVVSNPLRAVICALGHVTDREVLKAVTAGLQSTSLPVHDLSYYLTLILSEAPASLLEAIMPDPKPEFATKFMERFLAQGRREGEAEGRREGEAEGRREGARKGLRAILAKRRITLSLDDEKRIDACTDLETVERWFDRAIDARIAADVFADD